jgi:RNA polymerase sigma-70 factor (ECF subfamily)
MRFLRSRKVLQQDDATIIAAYRETSDNSYLGILFDRYSHLAFAVSMNYLKNEEDSKDAVIHVFEKLAVDLKKYEINNFSHWLYSVTKNYCLKQLNKRTFTIRLDEGADYLASDDKEQDEPLTDQLLSHLDEAITTLNEEQKKCIKLFYFEDKSYREIETMTGYTFEKVKSYIQNGKRNLKIYLLKKK